MNQDITCPQCHASVGQLYALRNGQRVCDTCYKTKTQRDLPRSDAAGRTVLKTSSINVQGGTQMREGIDRAVVDEYAAAIADGAAFPPIVVYDDGAVYWLADGYHRLSAYQQCHADGDIPVDIRTGTRREAILFACGANAHHGLRRTNESKRNAVATIFRDPEWRNWSDREIARVCGVHHELVGRMRKEHCPDQAVRQAADGRQMNTRAISAANKTRAVTQPVGEDQQIATAIRSSSRAIVIDPASDDQENDALCIKDIPTRTIVRNEIADQVIASIPQRDDAQIAYTRRYLADRRAAGQIATKETRDQAYNLASHIYNGDKWREMCQEISEATREPPPDIFPFGIRERVALVLDESSEALLYLFGLVICSRDERSASLELSIEEIRDRIIAAVAVELIYTDDSAVLESWCETKMTRGGGLASLCETKKA